MNILIVGNGFDLSHYLPTKYDHFMDVMKAIEEKDLGQHIKKVFTGSVEDLPTLLLKVIQIKNALNEKNYEMNFDELFSKCREKWFIEKTQSMYDTDSINLNLEKIIEIQYQLKNNVWYQYFDQHVQDVKTWIDFETKINEALKVVSKFIVRLDRKLDEFGHFSHEINFYGEGEPNQIFLTREQCNLLEKLNIASSGYFIDQDDYDEDENLYYIKPVEIGELAGGSLRFYINGQYIQQYSGYGKVHNDNLLNHLQKKIDEFIEIFNLYLELIVSQLSPINRFSIESEDWVKPGKIFSFNYTNTYQRIHESVNVEYLHGSHGVEQNIVLGVSDLEDESLKKIKAYGFTKYHQKLFKDTDYLFLDGFKEKVKNHKRSLEEFERDYQFGDKSNQRKIFGISEKLNLNFYIWGHSLDVSDKDYIVDLFSLNDNLDRNVKVIVYHFNKSAKFDLLNNLLAILGKDKVEHWMKNKWLQFKENPKIVPENAITLEDLPKA